MDTLADRFRADLEMLNDLARRRLPGLTLPPTGAWTRCWNLTEERPAGFWHLVASTNGYTRLSYRCGQIGFVVVAVALRFGRDYTIQRSDRPPPEGACRRCMRLT